MVDDHPSSLYAAIKFPGCRMFLMPVQDDRSDPTAKRDLQPRPHMVGSLRMSCTGIDTIRHETPRTIRHIGAAYRCARA